MNSKVEFQRLRVFKRFVALLADEWTFTNVCFRMLGQLTSSCEAFTAFDATELPLWWMSFLMRSETYGLSKTFVAFIANKRLFPLWINLCVLRSLLWVNFLSHSSQMNGFSLVWILSCILRSPPRENCLVQWLQWYGFSPVWILSCLFKYEIVKKDLPHWEQTNCFSPEWFSYVSITFSKSNILFHTLGKRRVFPVREFSCEYSNCFSERIVLNIHRKHMVFHQYEILNELWE